jgi:hypothetical protein
VPKNFSFWNELASLKEHKKLAGNPNFYNFWAKSSNISRKTCFDHVQNHGFSYIFFNEIFDHKKLIEGNIKLYQSIERKLLYKTLYFIYVIMHGKNRKIHYNMWARPFFHADFLILFFYYALIFQAPSINFIYSCRASKDASFDKKIFVPKY